MSVKNSLEKLLNRPGLLDKCEQWRSRKNTMLGSDYLGDVYDGEVWQKFCSQEFNNFLCTPHSYLLNINVDWFQPFVRGTTYSTGAIYLTVQNLPRQERYLQSNLILVGLLPGPSEPKSTMNSYLTPLVEELHELWNGVVISVKASNSLKVCIRIKAALSCCACDIPASRKLCGFLGHNATYGCNKCLKKFIHTRTQNGGNTTDYSGFDRENWPLRTNLQHRRNIDELLKEQTPTSLQQAESNKGVRYSILLSLRYFDAVQFTIVDPMHNLFLGTGKHSFEIWVENELISKKDYITLEEKMKQFITPYNAGRLPTSIGSGFGGFTANQWSNWITIFSPILLKELLPAEHMCCWLLFVRACVLLKPRFIRKVDVESADLYLLQYCKKVEELYGPKSITPNMHLHVHLKQCILDYGPLHAFWCYPFERFNGILGNFHSNRKSIESQLMKKFLLSQGYADSSFIPSDIAHFLDRSDQQKSSRNNTDADVLNFLHIQSSPLRLVGSFYLSPSQSLITPLSPHSTRVLSSKFIGQLQCIYEQLYPNRTIAHMPHFYRQHGRISLSGDTIGCVMRGSNNCQSSSVVAAYWPGSGSSLHSSDYTKKRIGVIQYFINHTVEFYKDDSRETDKLQHIFAYVYWKKQHPNADWFGLSAIVCDDCFEESDAC